MQYVFVYDAVTIYLCRFVLEWIFHLGFYNFHFCSLSWCFLQGFLRVRHHFALRFKGAMTPMWLSFASHNLLIPTGSLVINHSFGSLLRLVLTKSVALVCVAKSITFWQTKSVTFVWLTKCITVVWLINVTFVWLTKTVTLVLLMNATQIARLTAGTIICE